MESLKQRFAAFAPTDATNEAQTEQEWMRPVLQELGHSFEVQASLKVPGTIALQKYLALKTMPLHPLHLLLCSVTRELSSEPSLTKG
jgi:hypothetical protein